MIAIVRLMRNSLLALMIVVGLFALNSANAADRIPVKVGAYEYGVVYYFQDGEPNGIVPIVIRMLNEIQTEFEFQLAETSSRRRYQSVASGEVDLILLESSQWEWQAYDVSFSEPIVTETDVYLALADRKDHDQLFADVTRNPMLCVLGFHYGFADFNADPAYLQDNFDVLLRYNEKEVLDGLLAGEAPIGIVSEGFLARQIVTDPDLRHQVVSADKPDAVYDLVSVLANSSPITLADFNRLIDQLHATGEVERLWQQLHIGATAG